jgi:hypothetical protein
MLGKAAESTHSLSRLPNIKDDSVACGCSDHVNERAATNERRVS